MKFEEKLNGEYLDVYKEVMDEFELENLSVSFKEEIKNDILEMFLSAQDNGTQARTIVGDDVKDFVQVIASDFYGRNKNIFSVFKIIIRFIMYVSIISFIRVKSGSLSITTDFLILPLVIIASGLLSKIFAKKISLASTKNKTKNIYEYTAIIVGSIICGAITEYINLKPLFTLENPYFLIVFIFIGSILLDIFIDSKIK
ncbi:MAG: hypothetical protein ACRC57_05005 [Sarcina sp.]